MNLLLLFILVISPLSFSAFEDKRMMLPPNPCNHFMHGSIGGRSFLYSTPSLRVNFPSAMQICSSCFGLSLLDVDRQIQEHGSPRGGSFWTSRSLAFENHNLKLEYEDAPHRILCGESEMKCTDPSGCSYDSSIQKRSEPYTTTTNMPYQPTGQYYPTKAPVYQPTAPHYPPQYTMPTTQYPTKAPTSQPTYQPTGQYYPTMAPTEHYPTKAPTDQYPTYQPTTQYPTKAPTSQPTYQPTMQYPTMAPTSQSKAPTSQPSYQPTTQYPTKAPTSQPTYQPTMQYPTTAPTSQPTYQPTTQYPTTAPTSQPTHQPTTQYPTTAPSEHYPTMTPSEHYPTMTPSYQTDSPTSVPYPTQQPTEHYPTNTPSGTVPTSSPTAAPTESICDNFMNVVTATKTYYVSESFLKLSFQNAASLCKFCFNTNLADISNAVAIIGSPFHDQYWTGSYDQGGYTCNLMFVNHTLAAILDGSTKMRFMCDSYRSAEPSCNGFSKKRADNPEIFSSYTYPSSAPSFAPTRSPTYSPTQYPTSEPTSEPTSGPTYEPSYNPTDTPTSGPTHNPTTHYATDGPTSQSVCDKFSFFVEATKTYYVSDESLRTTFRDAGDLCRTCFHTNLADISNAVAIVGSPFFDNYWVGSYDQGEYTCNLMFVNHSLAAISDGKTSLRVICDGVRPAEMKCNGFPVKKRSDGEPDHGEASPEIAHTSVSPTSTCGKFKSTIVGHKTYYVSDPSLHLDFTNAAQTCSSCFSRNLADISHGAALAGSPEGDQFWVGSYSNGAYTCNLVFGNHTLAAIEDDSTPLRFMCDSELPSQTKCQGFPGHQPTSAPTSSSCQFDPVNVGGKSFIISLNSEASFRCATCLNRRLADISNGVAFASSPKNEPFWVGSYDQAPLTCNLLWSGINLNVQPDGNAKYRYLCDTTLLPTNKACDGKK